MMQSRTHNCGELRAQHAGEHVKLVGWMENVREVGGSLAFVVLRDFYGTTQIVVETSELLAQIKGYNKESTISVEGTVRERASKNPKLPTGDIEVVPTKIEVLGRCRYNELPFEINRSRDADEALRLKYRYLDLRNPAVKKNIILRCNVIAALRQAMMAHDFLEITTPILTASSPEGARDYLVPARKHPGKFYALPQAPQQFKQLLMTSGFDRYFQIAPCFRDEDARGDRSPGEFYQLDMEMAFATQEDVFAVLEDVLPPIFAKFGTYNVRAKEEAEAAKLVRDAHLLSEAGCFGIVLEKIPAALATRVTSEIPTPTIGIGAGAGCDGQVLVCNDLLGVSTGFCPKFVKKYANLHDTTVEAVKEYIADVKARTFPAPEHTFKIDDAVLEKLY